MKKSDHSLKLQLLNLITSKLFFNNQEYNTFLVLLKSGKIIQEQNPQYHCNVFFIPYDRKNKRILIVDHKKAKQWIVPGGHIEPNELLEDSVIREVREELGLNLDKVSKPFLFSVMNINNDGQKCKAHYDSWFLIPIEEKLNIDFTEFNDAKWVNKQQAKKLITHPSYLKAIEQIKGF